MCHFSERMYNNHDTYLHWELMREVNCNQGIEGMASGKCKVRHDGQGLEAVHRKNTFWVESITKTKAGLLNIHCSKEWNTVLCPEQLPVLTHVLMCLCVCGGVNDEEEDLKLSKAKWGSNLVILLIIKALYSYHHMLKEGVLWKPSITYCWLRQLFWTTEIWYYNFPLPLGFSPRQWGQWQPYSMNSHDNRVPGIP